MNRTVIFLCRQMLLGTGLAMDAFSVSVADGLREHHHPMTWRRMCLTAGVYGGFQAFMPLTGRTLFGMAAERFNFVRNWIPWAGGCILLYLGGKMLWDEWSRVHSRKNCSGVTHSGNASGNPYRETSGNTSGNPLGNPYREMSGNAFATYSGLFLQGIATSVDALSAGCILVSYPLTEALTAAGIIAAVTFGWCLAGLCLGQRFGEYVSHRAPMAGGMLLCGIGLELLFRTAL